jgi:hypothetical protein
MSFQDPVVRMRGLSFVTATLGGNAPQLGQIAYDGTSKYMFIYNAAANSEIYPGYAVVPIPGGASPASVTVSSVSSADIPVGVGKNATIPTANYGWVVTRGYEKIQMGNYSATTGSLLEISANGVFDIVSNTTGNYGNACGKCLVGINSNVSGSAFINMY